MVNGRSFAVCVNDSGDPMTWRRTPLGEGIYTGLLSQVFLQIGICCVHCPFFLPSRECLIPFLLRFADTRCGSGTEGTDCSVPHPGETDARGASCSGRDSGSSIRRGLLVPDGFHLVVQAANNICDPIPPSLPLPSLGERQRIRWRTEQKNRVIGCRDAVGHDERIKIYFLASGARLGHCRRDR